MVSSIIEGGARLFDEGRYFEAHEAWEAHWLRETDPTRRNLLQGLIQIAAGFYKLVDKDSPESAERLVARGLAKLDGCPSPIEDVDLAAFRERVRMWAVDHGAGRKGGANLPKITAAAPVGRAER